MHLEKNSAFSVPLYHVDGIRVVTLEKLIFLSLMLYFCISLVLFQLIFLNTQTNSPVIKFKLLWVLLKHVLTIWAPVS